RAHGRGRAQDVDHEYRAPLDLGGSQAGRRKGDVELHTSGRRSWDSRSRKRVSTVPAAKSGCRMTRARNGMVVVTPSRMKLSSAWPMRLSASARLLPCTMTLARS